MIYSHAADFSVLLISILLLVALKLIYTHNSSRLVYIKLALYNLIYCSIISMIYYARVIPNFTKYPELLLYSLYNSLQIGMVTELVLLTFYMYELLGYKNKKIKLYVLGIAFIFSVLHLASSITHAGFYIENNKLYNVGINYLYLASYLSGVVALVLIMLNRSKVVVSHINKALCFAFGFCVLIALDSSYRYTISYILLTYLIPIIVIIFLFHSNSFSSNFGTLDRRALQDSLSELVKANKSFYFVYFDIPDLDKIKDADTIMQDFKAYIKTTKYKNFVFKYNTYSYVLLYNSDLHLNLIKPYLEKMYDKYCISYQVFIVPNNPNCDDLRSYITFCRFLKQKYTLGTHFVNQTDLDGYKKYSYIKEQLKDMAECANLCDERILVYCQPILDVEKNIFTTAEALMRLNLEKLGVVYPNDFIALAEQEGLIHYFTLVILNKVCSYLESDDIIQRITINISMFELTKPNFYDDIINVISKFNITYDRLGFEVTESMDSEDWSKASDVLSNFRNLGIKIYLDDFGTGYSNLEHIIKMPIDIIKVDRSLVVSSGVDEAAKYMVENISNMFDIIGYKLLYEGVEDNVDQERCIDMKAGYLQGFRYSKPFPIEQLYSYVREVNIQ